MNKKCTDKNFCFKNEQKTKGLIHTIEHTFAPYLLHEKLENCQILEAKLFKKKYKNL
jgi:hypothetical protein